MAFRRVRITPKGVNSIHTNKGVLDKDVVMLRTFIVRGNFRRESTSREGIERQASRANRENISNSEKRMTKLLRSGHIRTTSD